MPIDDVVTRIAAIQGRFGLSILPAASGYGDAAAAASVDAAAGSTAVTGSAKADEVAPAAGGAGEESPPGLLSGGFAAASAGDLDPTELLAVLTQQQGALGLLGTVEDVAPETLASLAGVLGLDDTGGGEPGLRGRGERRP